MNRYQSLNFCLAFYWLPASLLIPSLMDDKIYSAFHFYKQFCDENSCICLFVYMCISLK